MISLIAVQPDDGWLYFRDRTSFKLMKPPFEPSSITAVSATVVGAAINGGNVLVPGDAPMDFTSVDALVRWARTTLRGRRLYRQDERDAMPELTKPTSPSASPSRTYRQDERDATPELTKPISPFASPRRSTRQMVQGLRERVRYFISN